MNTQIVPGSISAIAKQNGQSLAESFLSVDIIVIVDVSGSMGCKDSRGGKSRYDVACEELASLQKNMPGKMAIVAFDNGVQFCPGGVATFLGGGTNLKGALEFVKIADVPDMKFILISDGEPDDESGAIAIAKTFTNKIDVVYVGPEEYPAGKDFLARLAKVTGGKSVTVDRAKELGASLKMLLLKG